jgi:thioredoxin 1
MPYDPIYHEQAPSREELEHMEGPVLLEFGANWCGICGGFAPQLQGLMKDFPQVRHIKVEDGKGKPLGRSFRVKLWPTLVFLRDGQVMQQVSRPSREEARAGLQAITAPQAASS